MKLSCFVLALCAVASTGEASWDWYTGKSNKMPPAIRYTTSERAQKQRMNKLVGPKDSFGTMLGNVIVNQFDEDGKRLDAKRRDAQRRARHRNRLAARANEHNQRSLANHCKFNRCSERCHCEARGPYYLHHGECLTADNCCNTEGRPSGGSYGRYRNDLYSKYFPNVDPQLVQESMRNLDQRTAKNLFWSNCRKWETFNSAPLKTPFGVNMEWKFHAWNEWRQPIGNIAELATSFQSTIHKPVDFSNYK